MTFTASNAYALVERSSALSAFLAASAEYAAAANLEAPTLSDDDRAMYAGSDEDLRAWVDDCEARVGLNVAAWRAATEAYIAARAGKLAEELAIIREEFRTYDGEALGLEGFEARPWHNDTCPKWLHDMPACSVGDAREPCLVLWGEYVDPAEREHEGTRFLLQYCPDSYCTEAKFEIEGETLDDIVAGVNEFHRNRFGVVLPDSVPLWVRATAAFAPEFLVGQEFLAVLGEWLTPEQVDTCYAGDLTEAHDYCDANMAVDEAARRVIGRSLEPSVDAELDIFNNAWDVARACR